VAPPVFPSDSKIIAWRPLPAEAVEPPREPGELPRWKDRLPREYLIKFKGRSFRHLVWVPHAWLQVVAAPRLRNFLEKGVQLDLVTDATLAARGDQMAAPTISNVLDDAEVQHSRQLGQLAGLEAEWEGHGPPPDDVAEDSLPVDWSVGFLTRKPTNLYSLWIACSMSTFFPLHTKRRHHRSRGNASCRPSPSSMMTRSLRTASSRRKTT
jgi:hypothetical protein